MTEYKLPKRSDKSNKPRIPEVCYVCGETYLVVKEKAVNRRNKGIPYRCSDCANRSRRKYKIGDKYGMLTIVSETGEHNPVNNGAILFCTCDCGGSRYIDANFLTQNAHYGINCGCTKEERKIRGQLSQAELERKRAEREAKIEETRIQTAKNTLYSRYTCNAKARNIPFELSKEEFERLTQENCYYCGTEPNQKITKSPIVYKYNGVDRIDSSKGYNKNNTVPCCMICNKAKLDYSVTFFYEWIRRAYHHIYGSTQEIPEDKTLEEMGIAVNYPPQKRLRRVG